MRLRALVLVLSGICPVLCLAGPSPLDRPLPASSGAARIVRGAQSLPQASLVAAIAAAQPGDVIELAEGTYTGRFSISRRPNLTLRAAPVAHVVLTHRDPRFAATNALWSPVAAMPDVWRTTEPVGSSVYWASGRRILIAKSAAHFDQIRHDQVATVLRNVGETLLYLEGQDPRTTPLWISGTDGAVLACDQSPGLVLEGLDVRFGGAVNINLGVGCDDAVLDTLTLFGARDGIRAKDGLASGVTVRRSWIVNSLDERWYYRDVKGNSTIEGGAIVLPGKRHRIEDNIVEGWFNGIVTFCFVASCEAADTVIRRNVVRDILDDSIELDAYFDGGEVSENHVSNAFVALSFDPRLVHVEGRPTRIYRNTFETLRRPKFDRDPNDPDRVLSYGRPTTLKIQPTTVAGKPFGPRDLDLYQNTLISGAEVAKGAPQGSGIAYPVRLRWRNNVMISQAGPIVRHSGTALEGNEFDGNLYQQLGPGTMIENWGVSPGTRTAYQSLATARASAAGKASDWEANGLQGDPLLALDSAPPLPAGWPDSVELVGARDRGALERGPQAVESAELLATGWIVARGRGFEPGRAIPYHGAPLRDLVVVSSTTAVGRLPDFPPAPPILLDVAIEPAPPILLGWTLEP